MNNNEKETLGFLGLIKNPTELKFQYLKDQIDHLFKLNKEDSDCLIQIIREKIYWNFGGIQIRFIPLLNVSFFDTIVSHFQNPSNNLESCNLIDPEEFNNAYSFYLNLLSEHSCIISQIFDYKIHNINDSLILEEFEKMMPIHNTKNCRIKYRKIFNPSGSNLIRVICFSILEQLIIQGKLLSFIEHVKASQNNINLRNTISENRPNYEIIINVLSHIHSYENTHITMITKLENSYINFDFSHTTNSCNKGIFLLFIYFNLFDIFASSMIRYFQELLIEFYLDSSKYPKIYLNSTNEKYEDLIKKYITSLKESSNISCLDFNEISPEFERLYIELMTYFLNIELNIVILSKNVPEQNYINFGPKRNIFQGLII